MTTATAIPLREFWAFDGGLRKYGKPTLHWSRPEVGGEIDCGVIHVTQCADDVQPRHRHTFEQIRYVVSGSMTYGRNRTARAGDCVYFPESVPYGPVSYEEGEIFLLQWRGPSEHGAFLDYVKFKNAANEMREFGEFDLSKGGVFRHAAGRVQDGYEAVAEYILGRPIHYSEPRFNSQIQMRGSAFPALEIDGVSGVLVKHLGCFGEVGPNIKLIEFQAGSILPAGRAQSQQTWDVIRGSVSYDGKSYSEQTVIDVAPGADRAQIRAETPTEMLVIQLGTSRGRPMPFGEF